MDENRRTTEPDRRSALDLNKKSRKEKKEEKKQSEIQCDCIKCDKVARDEYLSKLFPQGKFTKKSLNKSLADLEEGYLPCRKSVNIDKMSLEEIDQCMEKAKEDNSYLVANEYLENLKRDGLL